MTTLKKWLLAVCGMAVLLPYSANGEEPQSKRFIEHPDEQKTTTYDLSTVKMVQPGKFAVTETTMLKPDILRVALQMLDEFYYYCAHGDGKYAVPEAVKKMVPSGSKVDDATVETNGIGTKYVHWSYPYKESPHGSFAIACPHSIGFPDDPIFEERTSILNGKKFRSVFDCRRGLLGVYLAGDDERDSEPAIIEPVKKDTVGFDEYLLVCRAVTHENPYVPDNGNE